MPVSGHLYGVPTRSGIYSYNLRCSGPNGDLRRSVVVTVG